MEKGLFKYLFFLFLSLNLQALDLDLKIKKYFSGCDQVFNNGYFINCYDYKLKSTKFSFTRLDGDLVNKKNIKKRPRFYENLDIPRKYRVKYSDYTRSGYDRGHINSDASFDYSLKSQKATYVMSNIVPQRPKTNRKSYLKVEKYERLLAKKLGSVNVFTMILFKEHPKRIGRAKTAIPDGFVKVFYKDDFQKCFYIPNDDKVYKLKELAVECKRVLR
jgi:endonuclease G